MLLTYFILIRVPFPLLADTVRFSPWALLSAGGLSGVGSGSMRQVFLSLQISPQRDFCPVADSQAFWFMWFSSHTMAVPNLCSGGAFAPRVPDLWLSEGLTLVKRGGGCVQQQQLRSPLRGCWSWSHHRGLWPGAISCGKLRTLQDGYLEDILRAENPESHLERHISFSVHHLKAKGPFFPLFFIIPSSNLNFLVLICRWISSNLISVQEKICNRCITQ